MTERRFGDGYWDDPFVQSLSKEGKLPYAYLWTNKHCNPAGLYQITPSTIAFETKLAEADMPRLLDQLEQLGETAEGLKQALGSNGHRADKLGEIKELLEHRANK